MSYPSQETMEYSKNIHLPILSSVHHYAEIISLAQSKSLHNSSTVHLAKISLMEINISKNIIKKI